MNISSVTSLAFVFLLLLFRVDGTASYAGLNSFDDIFDRVRVDLSSVDSVIGANMPYHDFKLMETLTREPERYSVIIEAMRNNFAGLTAETKDPSIWSALLISAFSDLQEDHLQLIEGLLNESLLVDHPLAIYGNIEPFDLTDEDSTFDSDYAAKMKALIVNELARIESLLLNGSSSDVLISDILVLLHQYSLCVEHQTGSTFKALNYIIQGVKERPEPVFWALKKNIDYEANLVSIESLKAKIVNEVFGPESESDRLISKMTSSVVNNVDPATKNYQMLISWTRSICDSPLSVENSEIICEALVNPDTKDKIRLFMAVYSLSFHGAASALYGEREWLLLIHEAFCSLKEFGVIIDEINIKSLINRICISIAGEIRNLQHTEIAAKLGLLASLGLEKTIEMFFEVPQINEFIIFFTKRVPEALEILSDSVLISMKACHFGSANRILLKVFSLMSDFRSLMQVKSAASEGNAEFFKLLAPQLLGRDNWYSLVNAAIDDAVESKWLTVLEYLLEQPIQLSNYISSYKFSAFLTDIMASRGFSEERVCAFYSKVSDGFFALDVGRLLINAASRGYLTFIKTFITPKLGQLTGDTKADAIITALANNQIDTFSYLWDSIDSFVKTRINWRSLLESTLKKRDYNLAKLIISRMINNNAVVVKILLSHDQYDLINYIEKGCGRPLNHDLRIAVMADALSKAADSKSRDPIQNFFQHFRWGLNQDDWDEALLTAASSLEFDQKIFLIYRIGVSFSDNSVYTVCPQLILGEIRNMYR